MNFPESQYLPEIVIVVIVKGALAKPMLRRSVSGGNAESGNLVSRGFGPTCGTRLFGKSGTPVD